MIRTALACHTGNPVGSSDRVLDDLLNFFGRRGVGFQNKIIFFVGKLYTPTVNSGIV
jgi:hypothetical protein